MPSYHAHLESPIAPLLLVGDGEQLAELHLVRDDRPRSAPLGSRRDDHAFGAVREQLEAYFARERRSFDLPLLLDGTPWQQVVWQALRQVPYGTTMSYGELAAQLGRPGAQRAVGSANARNPISIV